MKIIIFGGGISGLTLAHRMILDGNQVTLYESEKILGGMARSIRDIDNIPSEHSWRGYAPFYHNLRNMLKEIPTDNNGGTVHDNLSKPINFKLLTDNKTITKTRLTDYIILYYVIGKSILSDKRNKVYYETLLEPIFKKYLSDESYNKHINYILGPGWGLHKHTASIGHFAKFSEFSYSEANNIGWSVMNKPTNEGWFDIWKEYLSDEGVIFKMNNKLEQINTRDGKIINCVSNGVTVIGDEYVFCINPFNMETVLKQSNMNHMHAKHQLSNNYSDDDMIAFTITFPDNIYIDMTGYVLLDSELNITFCPQDALWDESTNLGYNVKTIWSGTCIITHDFIHMSRDQLKLEILDNILGSDALQSDIYNNNGFNITANDVNGIDIWYEWEKRDPYKLSPVYNKYSNNIYNQKYRLSQKTDIANMYISGAHTKTSTDIYSMEGAVESGILAYNLINKKYNRKQHKLYIHDSYYVVKLIRQIDNMLYDIGLPHFIDVCLIVVIIVILYLLSRVT